MLDQQFSKDNWVLLNGWMDDILMYVAKVALLGWVPHRCTSVLPSPPLCLFLWLNQINDKSIQSALTFAIAWGGGWSKCNEPWETCELPPLGVMPWGVCVAGCLLECRGFGKQCLSVSNSGLLEKHQEMMREGWEKEWCGGGSSLCHLC